MARRSFDDAFWGDTFVQDIEKDAKLLFAYLWTNKRCNSAGLYEITPKTISFETSIPIKDLPRLFEILKLKIEWIPDVNIVWVKNFLKHQPKSPQFLKSVASCLSTVNSNGIINDFLNYYSQKGVSIPYGNSIDTVGVGSGGCPELELELELDKELELEHVHRNAEGKTQPTGEMVNEVFSRIDKLRGYRPPKRKAEAASIIRMLKVYTPDQILKTYEKLKADKFWQDKELFMMTVESQIGAALNGAGENNPPKHKEMIR